MAMSLDSDVDVLKTIAFFQGFSYEHLKLIAFSAESRSLPEKLLLYDEGQLLHSAYVIVSGSLRGEHKVKGTERVIERDIGAGVILGARALILDTRASESVRVTSRTRVLQIRKVMFRRLLQEYPEITEAIHSRLARNMMQATAEFNEVARRLAAIEL
jgi:CRP-like cAMP-binding protein